MRSTAYVAILFATVLAASARWGTARAADPSDPYTRLLEQHGIEATAVSIAEFLRSLHGDDDVRRQWSRLIAGIEHPSVADAVDPRAVRNERRLVHVTRQHNVGPVSLDPLS